MTGRLSRAEWRWALTGIVIIVLVASVPYLITWLITPADKVYTGFMVNPLDGHSYLAKMRQGAMGNWLLRFPFTTEPQEGVFFYVYLLFLGHLAALFGSPLILTYHVARILSGVVLLALIYRFAAEFIEGVKQRRVAFLIIAMSSGAGWALASSGVVNVDLWVPESNTFYSLFANAHFPFAEAMMLVTYLAVAAPLDTSGNAVISARSRTRAVVRALIGMGASFALGLVQPFALVTTYASLGTFLIWRSKVRDRWYSADWARAILAGLAAAPVVIYYVVSSSTDPFLVAWSTQNLTPTPPLWQVVAGYGLLVPLALAGGVWCLRQRRGIFLVVWAGLNLVLLYAPFALQRRLLLGFHIPVALLASLGLVNVVWPLVGSRRFLVTTATLLLLIPSTLLVMLAPVTGATQTAWPLFMTADESKAMNWLRESTCPADIVLASPEDGLMIPGWAGNRVVYGHPFETVRAEQKKAEVSSFFAGESKPGDLVRKYGIRYIFVGPKEKELGEVDLASLQTDFTLAVVYSNDEVTIYEVSPLITSSRTSSLSQPLVGRILTFPERMSSRPGATARATFSANKVGLVSGAIEPRESAGIQIPYGGEA